MHMARMTLDTDDDDEEEVTYLQEEELRAFWLKSGMSASSYNEDIALSKMLLADNDDDDDDDDDDADEEEEDVIKNSKNKKTLAEKKITFLKTRAIGAAKTANKATGKATDQTNDKAAVTATSIPSKEKKPMLFQKILSKSRTSEKTERTQMLLKTPAKMKKSDIETDAEELEGSEGEVDEMDVGVENVLPVAAADLPVSDIPAGRSVGEHSADETRLMIHLIL